MISCELNIFYIIGLSINAAIGNRNKLVYGEKKRERERDRDREKESKEDTD